MGYCVRLADQRFEIPADKVEPCLNGILNTDNQWLQGAVKDAKRQVKHFEHLPPLPKLCEVVYNIWGFTFSPNKSDAIDKVFYDLEKMHDMEGFCNMVAEFVKSGSYLEFKGEDGKQWRYVFRDNKWKEVRPQVIWPED